MQIGIVGLPNVGKSTLFNALLKRQQAFVANYPFATIEPNVGVVPVPDERLGKLAEIEMLEEKLEKLPPIVPATVRFIDIAGLVKGAAKGEGLGNKFLAHIREVDAICHVVRYFQNNDIAHVEGAPDPKRDTEIIETELILADLQTLENQREPKKGTKEEVQKYELVKKLKEELNIGKLAKDVSLKEEELELLKDLNLLTLKPILKVANVQESQLKDNFQEGIIPISAKLEEELSALSEDEQKEYLKTLGLEDSGLGRLIKKAYETLDLISFLTAGEKEVRAWTIKRGTDALRAAGVIHTDFMKKFIKAEIVSFEDFVKNSGWKKARELGKTKFEGKDYVIKNGEIVEFMIGN
jgi:GTP-binding protein YchF